MKLFILIFSVLAIIFALGAIAYVIVDVILDAVRKKEQPQSTIVELPPEPTPPEEPPVQAMPEPLESVKAEEVDQLISDDLAMSSVLYEEWGENTGKRTYVNIGVIDRVFEAGDVVDINTLKEKKLIPKDVKRVKILADGILSKPLTVKSTSFSVQAIKMIELTGGTVIILRAKK